jgi:integrase
MPDIDRLSTGNWQARWRDVAGRQRKRTFARKSDARAFVATVEADKLRGVYVDPGAGRLTLRAYAETRWMPAQVHLRPNTLETYRSHLSKHVLPALGAHPLNAVRRPDCKTFVSVISSKLAPATVTTVYAVLRSLMQSAVDDGLIPSNPCSRVPLPRVERRVVEPLTAQAVRRLAAAITPRYAIAVWLGAGVGLREGEALGLTAARVDFLRRRVYVEEQLQGVNGGPPQMSPLKTRASRRVVPVDDFVLEQLSQHLAGRPVADGGPVLRNRLGELVRRSSFVSCWQAAVEAAGLPKGTRFHDLRHFYASSLIAAGLHPKAIQVRLGHATISETMDTYGHLFPDAEDSGRGAIDAALRESDVPVACPEVAP